MKVLTKWVLLALLLAAVVVVTCPVATAQTPATVKLQLYPPTGGIEVTQLHAPRVSDLNGKTICELSDNQWQAQRTFVALREVLQKQFPTAKFIAYTEFPTGSDGIDNDKTAQITKDKGCQAVIVGNAG